MSGNACEEFFELHSENQNKVVELQKIENVVTWEAMSASKFSPGFVRNEEMIVRQVTHPAFVEPNTQKIKPAWFKDVTNRGFSCDRLDYTTIEAVAANARARADEWNAKNADKPLRTFHSLGKLAVVVLRGVTREGQRAIGVFDTALKSNPAHADVCQVVPDSAQSERSVRYEMYAMTEQIFV